ncbi:MAG TPA: nucleotidyltransferase family protein [Blastocatellia bacterium]|nr:nucleotidyltransferase family protein [Blastocatellia bacterium]
MLSSLQGNFAAFPGGVSERDLMQFAQYTDDSGIQPFLSHKLKLTGALQTCPALLQQTFERRRLMELISHNLRKNELLRLLEAFHEAHVRVVILKGAALSYLIYPEPSVRTCCDIDLYVSPRKVAAADLALRSLGYELIRKYLFEFTYLREDQGAEHILDLHWRLSDSAYFGVKFDFNEIYKRSIPVCALSPRARTLDMVDSLINACIHMAHHETWDRLIWLTDVYLLCHQLSSEQFHEFVTRAIKKRCGSECLEALRMTRKIYGIDLNHPAIKRLIDQKPVSFRNGDSANWDFAEEFYYTMLGSPWVKRFNILWRALFPPLVELNERYDTRIKIMIPFIYLYRLLIKAPKLLIFRRRGKSA